MDERRYSLKEAQDLLGVSERTIHRWIKSGKLKSYKPGRDHQIPESAIRGVIEGSEVYPEVQWPLPFEESPQRPPGPRPAGEAPDTGRPETQNTIRPSAGIEDEDNPPPKLEEDFDAAFNRIAAMLRAAGVGEEAIAEYEQDMRRGALELVAAA